MTPDQTEYTVLPSCLASDRRLDDLGREEGLESACEKANAHVGFPKLKLAYLLCLSGSIEKNTRKTIAARAARVPLPPPRSPEEPRGPLQEEEEGGGDDAGGEKMDHFTVFSRSFSPVLAVILYFLTSVLNRGMFNRMSPSSNHYSNDFCISVACVDSDF